MRRPRLSIAGLMTVVLFVAVVLASLEEATELWAKAMFTVAIAASGVALLGMLFRRGIERATWSGRFILGAGYLALCFGSGCDTQIMPRLLSTALIDGRYFTMEYSPTLVGERVWVSKKDGDEFAEGQAFGMAGTEFYIEMIHGNRTTASYSPTRIRAISQDTFRQLVHADLSLGLAFIGGMIARRFVARNEAAENSGR
jgi:hypothetical protein